MSIDEFIARPPKGYWLNNLDIITTILGESKINGTHIEQILEKFQIEISKSRGGKATNWIVAALVLDEDISIKLLRKKGMLRYSKVIEKGGPGPLQMVVSKIIEAASILGLSENSLMYFKSISHLLELSVGVSHFRRGLLGDLSRLGEHAIKTLIAGVDLLFYLEHVADRRISTDSWRHYLKEELAEACTLCLEALYKTRTIKAGQFSLIDENGVLDGTYYGHLVNASKIGKYFEWEILIDLGLARCDKVEQDKFLLSPTDVDFEKATQLGFMNSEWSDSAEFVKHYDKDQVTIAAVSEKLHNMMAQNSWIEVVDTPVRRIVMKIPDITPMKDLLNRPEYFMEEGIYFHTAMKNYFMGEENLRDLTISGNLTAWDLVLVLRLINILRGVYKIEAEKYIDSEPELLVRSLLPVFKIEDFSTLLSFVLSEDKSTELISLLSWTPKTSEDQSFADFQYRPIICSEGYCMVPMNIVGTSDLLRNILQISRGRPYLAEREDIVETALSAAFTALEIPCQTNIDYKYDGKYGEIDLLVKFDDHIFLFECKAPLLPATLFELRTTLDHCKKAAKQLDQMKSNFNQTDFVKRLEEKLSFSLGSLTKVSTCIITANRMFPGARIQGHPVRHLFEFGSYLESGAINAFGKQIKFTKGVKITAEELSEYINKDIVHEILFKSMRKQVVSYQFADQVLEVDHYPLNTKSLADNLGLKMTDDELSAFVEPRSLLPDPAK